MHHDPAAPVVICSPHFDDAVLDCWSMLTRPGACGVITVFGGVPRAGYVTWWDQLSGARDSSEAVRARIEEDTAALAIAGRAPHVAGLLDAQYRIRPSRLVHATMVRVPPLRWRAQRVPLVRRLVVGAAAPTVEQMLDQIARCVPAASLVCAPAAIGGHPDHVLVRSAAVELARRGMPVRLYADLPYAAAGGWPGWVTGGSTTDPRWARDLRGVVDDEVEMRAKAVIEMLTTQQQADKRAAISCYRSQVGIEGSGIPQLLRHDAVLAHEVYWPVTA